jgi:hypothetical protein
MPLYNTNDIPDEAIINDILHVNQVYSDIISRLHDTLDIETQRRIQNTISACCSREDLQLLTRLVRIFMENYRTSNNKRVPLSYTIFAILYYYYHLELIEFNVAQLLDLSVLKLYGVSPEYISGIHVLSNYLITSNEPFVSEIRKSILRINNEPFVGGKKNRRKNGTRRQKRRSRRSKIRTKYRR